MIVLPERASRSMASRPLLETTPALRQRRCDCAEGLAVGKRRLNLAGRQAGGVLARAVQTPAPTAPLKTASAAMEHQDGLAAKYRHPSHIRAHSGGGTLDCGADARLGQPGSHRKD